MCVYTYILQLCNPSHTPNANICMYTQMHNLINCHDHDEPITPYQYSLLNVEFIAWPYA